MSMSRWYSIRENKKTNHIVDTAFFGKRKVYDYKNVLDTVFTSYCEAKNYIEVHGLSFKDVHIRMSYDFGAGVTNRDYIYKIVRR